MVCGASLDAPKKEQIKKVNKIEAGDLNALPAKDAEIVQGQIVAPPAPATAPASAPVQSSPPAPVLPGQPVDDPFFDVVIEDESAPPDKSPELPGEADLEIDFDTPDPVPDAAAGEIHASPAPVASAAAPKTPAPVPSAVSQPAPPEPPQAARTQAATETASNDAPESLVDLWPKEPTRPPAMDDDLSFLADQALEDPNFGDAPADIPQIPASEAAAADDDALAGLWDDLNIDTPSLDQAAPIEDDLDITQDAAPLMTPESGKLQDIASIMEPASGIDAVMGALQTDLQEQSSETELSPFSQADDAASQPQALADILGDDDFDPEFEEIPEEEITSSEDIDFDEAFTPEPESGEQKQEKESRTNPLGSLPPPPAAETNAEIAQLTSSQMARELANMAVELEVMGDIQGAIKLWRAAVLLDPLFSQAVVALQKLTGAE